MFYFPLMKYGKSYLKWSSSFPAPTVTRKEAFKDFNYNFS